MVSTQKQLILSNWVNETRTHKIIMSDHGSIKVELRFSGIRPANPCTLQSVKGDRILLREGAKAVN